ncbi:MAG: metallophosphoesterase [Rikenellaceae bacterium]
MKSIFSHLALYSVAAALSIYVGTSCCEAPAPTGFSSFDPETYEERLNFYVIADSGRNGYYEQKSVAELMGEMAAYVEPEFIAAAGDTHHFMGVESVNDPLWMTNFELVYSHPELMIPFFPVLGNHEYRGNTQSVIDYTTVSRRWEMPDRYYTNVVEGEGTSVRMVYVDTPPLIDKYRNDSQKYPDAVEQSMEEQLQWVDSVLTASTERWRVVVGHHPIYAYTTKNVSERTNMQERLDTILRRHDVDLYICGHIHSFQHLRATGSNIDYIVNGSASLAREVEPIDETQFCAGIEGFLVVSASQKELETTMVDCNGNAIYRFVRE